MVSKNRLRVQFGVRLIVIVMTVSIGWIGLRGMHHVAFPLFAGILLVVQIVGLVRVMEKPFRDLYRFFQAIEYSDFSMTFSTRSQNPAFKELHQSFDRVIQAFQKARAEKEAQYRYLQTIIQHIGIGILVFKQDGTVDMVNQAARRLFKMPQMKQIAMLCKLDSALPQAILKLKSGEKSRIQFMDSDSGSPMDLSLHAAQFVIQNERMTLVSIQNIQSELEEKELEAWQNLIRVLTHEIMNSITPISSLASTANSLIENFQGKPNMSESIRDIKQAVQTIESRSQGLLKFVQSYRKLTRIPKPEFEIVFIQKLFDRVVTLMAPRLKEKGIRFEQRVEPETLEITADPNLIEQVLINLLQNAVDWAGLKPGGEINLAAGMGYAGRPVIQVTDNGPGIVKEALEKIFIPFFTTKEDGSGIGLSLSRQIMRLHHGTIVVHSTPGIKTELTLQF